MLTNVFFACGCRHVRHLPQQTLRAVHRGSSQYAPRTGRCSAHATVPMREQACFGFCTACMHALGPQRTGRWLLKRATRARSQPLLIVSFCLLDPLYCAPTDPGLADDAGYSIAWGCCGHVFHLDCISRWLKTRSVCPL